MTSFYFAVPLPSYYIIIGTRNGIWQQFVDSKTNIATYKKLQTNNPNPFAVALDYNPVDKRIYWSDVIEEKIKRMLVSGVGGEETLVW